MLPDLTLVVLLLVLVTTALSSFNVLWRIDAALVDFSLSLWQRERSQEIVIVGIDERSIDRLGRWPWSRRMHALLIEKLSQHGARVIVMDIHFAEPTPDDAQADQLLIAATRNSRRVILPVVPERTQVGGMMRERLPITELASVASGFGHVDFEVDRDGLSRRSFLFAGMAEPHYPSLALAAIKFAEPAIGESFVRPVQRLGPSDGGRSWKRAEEFLLPFAGPPGHFQQVSFVDVIEDRVDSKMFEERYVLVGMIAAGLGDVIPTPVAGHSRPMTGVEVIANQIDAIRLGRMVQLMHPVSSWILTAALALLPLLVYPALSPRSNLLAAVTVLIGIALLHIVLLISAKLWFPPSAAAICVLLSYPLWAWRRLETTLRYLDAELNRLQLTHLEVLGDPHKLKRSKFDRALLIDAVDATCRLLGAKDWALIDESGNRVREGAISSRESPRDLTPGEWRRERGTLWCRTQNWLVGAEVSTGDEEVVRGDARMARLLFASLDEISEEPLREPVELLQARIFKVQTLAREIQRMEMAVHRGLAQMVDGFLLVNHSGTVLLSNRRAAQFLGQLDPNDLVGRNAMELLDAMGDDRESWRQELVASIVQTQSRQIPATGSDGTDLRVQFSPIDDAVGGVPGVVVNLADVTQMREVERRRAELVSFLSHDLRSPLVSLLALNTLAGKANEAAELRSMFERAGGYGERALRLVDQFLLLLRAESSANERFEVIDLTSVVLNSFDQAWADASAKGIELEQGEIEFDTWILGDSDLLERVVINVVSNAIKYSAPGDVVSISLTADAEASQRYIITVADTGPGIASADLSRLFNRFERLEQGQQAAQGWGLGLAFVKAVVDSHGGQVDVSSELGEGTAFQLSFNAVSAPQL